MTILPADNSCDGRYIPTSDDAARGALPMTIVHLPAMILNIDDQLLLPSTTEPTIGTKVKVINYS